MNDTTDSTAKDAATEWFVRMRDAPVSDASYAAFQAWLNEDPAHAEAYADLEKIWVGLDQIDPAEAAAVDLPTTEPRVLPGRRQSLRWMSLAASIALIGGIAGVATDWSAVLAEYRTTPGEQRRVLLSDGTTLHLNTATAISTEFTATRRGATVHSGEAYFEVARDPNRPFSVTAGLAEITVLGTAFSVKHVGDSVDVVVTKNRVEVSDPERTRKVVRAGQTVRVANGAVGAVATSNDFSSLAWRQGRLVFEGVPLGQVLVELERYRHGRIVITDASIQSLPVTGSFAISRGDAILDALEKTLPVRLTRLTDLLVLVSREPAR